MTSPNTLDETSLRLQQRIEQLVSDLAKGDELERCRRWKQIYSWAYNRTQGDPVKKSKLKAALVSARGGKCEDCGRRLELAELQMHRLDQQYACDRSRNNGYFAENVVLLCVLCHRKREAMR